MVGDDAEIPAPQEELPPGTEDLADPAKVYIHQLKLREGVFLRACRACRNFPVFHDAMERKICSGLKRCLYVGSQANEYQLGFKLASSQGLVLKLKG